MNAHRRRISRREKSSSRSFQSSTRTYTRFGKFSLHAFILCPGYCLDLSRAMSFFVGMEPWCGYMGPLTIQVGDALFVHVQLPEKQKHRTTRLSRSILGTSWSVDEMTLERPECDHRFCRQEIQSLPVWNRLWVLPRVSSRHPKDTVHWIRSR